MKNSINILILFLIVIISPCFSLDPPILLSPENYGFCDSVLSWSSVQNATHYRIEVVNLNSSFSLITTQTSINPYLHMNFNPYSGNNWRVKSYNNNGDSSSWTNYILFATPGWQCPELSFIIEGHPAATIVVPISSQNNINNIEWWPYDAIMVYNSNGILCGVTKCNTYARHEIIITVYGVIPLAPGHNGFYNGETYSLRIWNSYSAQGQTINTLPTYSQGNSFFITGDTSVVSTLTANSNYSTSISLSTGWNMISSNRTINNSTFSSIFGTIINEQNFLMKDGEGNVYWPYWGINDIGNWSTTKGYQVYSPDAHIIIIYGVLVNPTSYPISLPQGWHIIPYLKSNPMNIPSALASINNNYLLVKDGLGNVYWPDWGIDDIINMQPGQGYQIYMNLSDTLIYPPN